MRGLLCGALGFGEAVWGFLDQRIVDAGLGVEGKQLAQAGKAVVGFESHAGHLYRKWRFCKVKKTECADPAPEKTPSAA